MLVKLMLGAEGAVNVMVSHVRFEELQWAYARFNFQDNTRLRFRVSDQKFFGRGGFGHTVLRICSKA